MLARNPDSQQRSRDNRWTNFRINDCRRSGLSSGAKNQIFAFYQMAVAEIIHFSSNQIAVAQFIILGQVAHLNDCNIPIRFRLNAGTKGEAHLNVGDFVKRL